MGLVVLICYLVGIISLCSFVKIIYDKINSKINNKEYKCVLKFPFDSYEKNPLRFLVIGLIIILLTFIVSSSILSIIFPNNLRYKSEGTYCYYVIDKNNKAYPAKVEKTSYTEDVGEDYFGNPTSDTHIYVNLLELYIDNDTYDFSDDPKEINTDSYTTMIYYDEIESEDDEGYEEFEREFSLKLTNDVAYCPSFGKGKTNIDYFGLVFEVLVLLSEITMFIITIYVNRKE